MISLSSTSKMSGVKSWSLEALVTCPGSKGKDGRLVPACQGCYAVGGNYRYPNVRKPRIANKVDWTRDNWVADMIEALTSERFFRWFDSGDMYALGLAEKIYQVIKETPWCSHWLPTRMHKFPKFKGIIDRINSLPNAVVRCSSDSVTGEFDNSLEFSSTIVPSFDERPGVFNCKAPMQDGKCKTCKACWSKDVKTVAYLAHGKAMEKVIKSQLA